VTGSARPQVNMRRRLLRVAAAAGVAVLTLMTVGASDAGATPRIASDVALAASPAAASTTPVLRLAGQTTTVSAGHVFSLELAVPAEAKRDDHVEVAIYPALLTRTGFDEAAKPQPSVAAGWIYREPEILKTAKVTSTGAVVAQIPVGLEASGTQLPAFGPGTTTAGVYPVDVQLYNPQGIAVGKPLTTFLVYSPTDTGVSRLAVSLTVAVNAPPAFTGHIATTAPTSASAAALSQLVTTIAGVPGVPVTLEVTPQTLDALATGPTSDQATVTALAGLAAHGDELAPSPYVSVSLPGLDNAGLDTQVDNQLSSGAAALEADLHQAPTTSTWVLDEALGVQTLQLLMGRGLRQLILPDRDLSALPAADTTITYARPTELLDDSAGEDPQVVGADATLSARLAPTSDPVLAAEQILAELAMIKLEAPSVERGVAILAPTGQTIQPLLLHVLLAGLQDNPLVSAVTAHGLFSAITPTGTTGKGTGTAPSPATGSSGTVATPTTDTPGTAPSGSATAGTATSGTATSGTATSGTDTSGTDTSGTSTPSTVSPTTGAASGTAAPTTTVASGVSGATATTAVPAGAGGATTAGAGGATTPPVIRTLAGRSARSVPSAARIDAIATKIGAVATVVPGETNLIARMRQLLLVSESDQITGGQRRSLLASVGRSTARVDSSVKLVGATSVTLTARNVNLPLTIQSAPRVSTHVRLVLTSPKLTFKAYVPPDGTCSSGPTIEVCHLVLPRDQTTLRIPVEARTTGVFTLDISVQSPDGDVVLASSTDTVRSTAVSFVGWVLIFGACLFLGIWWIRDSRNGRRARQLVSPPESDDDDDDELDGNSRTDLRLVPPVGGSGVSPSRQVGGHIEETADRRNPEEIPT
jgi:hypothetical protein